MTSAPLTSAQCRAARALLNWSQDELAAASKVDKAIILDFESGKRQLYDGALVDLRNAFQAAGVEFLAGIGGQPGVKLRKGDGVIRATWDPPPTRPRE